MGVSCKAPNDISCDRVGLAAWLRRPATRLSAMIAGRKVVMQLPCGSAPGYSEPCGSYCRRVARDQPCGTYFEGFLRPAGLLNGPLRVRPDRGRYHWIGRRPTSGVVWIVAAYWNGEIAKVELRVPLSAGWG